MKKKNYQLIILDRDGVINHDSEAYIKKPEEWHAIEGSLKSIAKLNNAGYLVAIASNQSGLARGYFTQADVEAIHLKMQTELAEVGGHIDVISYCPHGPYEGCSCRKPKPGLLFNVAEHFHIDLKHALLVGDSLRDIEAAQAAHCKAVLVRTGKATVLPLNFQKKTKSFNCLADVVDNLENI